MEGAIECFDDEAQSKPNISQRMAALRKRRQDRNMERKEAQVEAGVEHLSLRSSSPSLGFFSGADGGDGALATENGSSNLPMHQTVDQWEDYFASLAAAGCDNGVRLSTAEMSLLAVHGAYSARMEEVAELNDETPHFDTIDELTEYCDEYRRTPQSQLSGVQRTVLNIKQLLSTDARRAQDKITMLEHELNQVKEQLIEGDPEAATGAGDMMDEDGQFGRPRLTKDDMIDDQRKELAILDLESNKQMNKISKLNYLVGEVASLGVWSICQPLCRMYLERGMNKWKLALLAARNISRYDVQMERLEAADSTDAVETHDATFGIETGGDVQINGRRGPSASAVGGSGGLQLHRALQTEEVEQPQYATQYQLLYESNMQAMLAARKVRLQRLQNDEEWTDSDSDHYASDEEMNQVLRSTEEAGKVGIILSYAAGLSLSMKQKEWLLAFMRLHNEWHLSAITRHLALFGRCAASRIKCVYPMTREEGTLGSVNRICKSINTAVMAGLINVWFDKFRQGRVGTYSKTGRYDSDQEMEDDYTQLAAYTRRMNINWTKERGCDHATRCFHMNYMHHWQNTIKLKLLSHKYSLSELDKLELVSEKLEANSDLKDERRVRENLEDANDKLKRELAKLRRDKAWMERFTSTG